MKILFIAPRMPYPPLRGDRVRAYYFIRELSKKHVVDLCSFYEKDEELSGIEEMKKYCRKIEIVKLSRLNSFINLFRSLINLLPFQVNYYYSRQMKNKIRKMVKTEKYDIYHFVLIRMMKYAKYCEKDKVVVDHIDALSLNMKRRARVETKLLTKLIFYLEYLNVKRCEKKAQEYYNKSIITSEIDKKALADNRIEIISNGVDSSYFAPMQRKKDIDLIFTGRMGYFPNANAAIYLCRKILPKILYKYPKATLYIIGIDPTNEVRALHDGKNIFVTGYVEDIREYLNRAKIFIAPLRSGSGIQNKILEAMACELPVISSSCGNAGIKGIDREQIIIADESKDIVDNIADLLQNRDKSSKLGRSARKFVLEEYGWVSKANQLEEVYRKCLNDKEK